MRKRNLHILTSMFVVVLMILGLGCVTTGSSGYALMNALADVADASEREQAVKAAEREAEEAKKINVTIAIRNASTNRPEKNLHVSLNGPKNYQGQGVTDSVGEAHFRNLNPGTHEVIVWYGRDVYLRDTLFINSSITLSAKINR